MHALAVQSNSTASATTSVFPVRSRAACRAMPPRATGTYRPLSCRAALPAINDVDPIRPLPSRFSVPLEHAWRRLSEQPVVEPLQIAARRFHSETGLGQAMTRSRVADELGGHVETSQSLEEWQHPVVHATESFDSG